MALTFRQKKQLEEITKALRGDVKVANNEATFSKGGRTAKFPYGRQRTTRTTTEGIF